MTRRGREEEMSEVEEEREDIKKSVVGGNIKLFSLIISESI